MWEWVGRGVPGDAEWGIEGVDHSLFSRGWFDGRAGLWIRHCEDFGVVEGYCRFVSEGCLGFRWIGV